MSRYLYSFLLTLSTYAVIIFSFISFVNATEKPIKQNNNVKISLITPPAPKPVELPKPEPIILPPELEVIPEPVIEPKPVVKKPKPKKKKKVVKPKPEPIVVTEPVVAQEPITKPVMVTPQPVAQPNIENLKKNFLGNVRATIVANKKYPKRAVRQNIVGRVKAVFDILQNGSVANIRVSGATNILKKAVKKSILKSFPMAVPTDLKKELPIKDVSVMIDFILK